MFRNYDHDPRIHFCPNLTELSSTHTNLKTESSRKPSVNGRPWVKTAPTSSSWRAPTRTRHPMASSSPSTGSPTRTASRQLAITCQSRLKFLSRSSGSQLRLSLSLPLKRMREWGKERAWGRKSLSREGNLFKLRLKPKLTTKLTILKITKRYLSTHCYQYLLFIAGIYSTYSIKVEKHS